MGAVCAVVYLLTIIIFIPFPFYKDIVAATSGGGNKEFVVERQFVETGRILHRFPHNKVREKCGIQKLEMTDSIAFQVSIISICNTVFTICCPLGHRRRFVRHSVATQALHTSLCVNSHVSGLFCRLRRHKCRGTGAARALPGQDGEFGLAVLCLHGCNFHFLPEQHQHSGWHQRNRGFSIFGHRVPPARQRWPISLRSSEHSKSSPSDRSSPVLNVPAFAIHGSFDGSLVAQLVSSEGVRG